MIDLTNELTVFVISAGNNPNYQPCLDALKKQTTKFKLKIIKDYTPMSKAFQEMLNRCNTKYYVEVDEDMVLNPNAIEIMYNKLTAENYKEAMVCYKLHDVHLKFDLYGVKMYKFDDFVKYPYNLSHPSCEVEQLDRMKADGYTFDKFCISQSIGQHSPYWNEELIFERYKNLMQKARIFRYSWMLRLPQTLYDVFKDNPTKLNYYAISGMLAGMFADKVMDKEKDATKKDKCFKRLDSYLEKPTQATLYLTSECNFKCSWCRRQHGYTPNAKEVDIYVARQLLVKFPSVSGICICGFGETLMAHNLIPVLKELKASKKVIGLITNGTLLTTRLPELIGAHQPNYISVSLNSHCQESHEKTTGTKTWYSVLDGIKAVVNSPIPCYVSSVVHADNLFFVPELLKLIKSLGVKTVHLHNLLPHHETNDPEKDKEFWRMVLQKDTHREVIENFKKLPEADIVKTFPILIDKSGGNGTCQFPSRMIGLDGDMNISICNSVYPCNGEQFGNLNDPNPWLSQKCDNFREDFVEGKIEACQKCFRNWQWL